jgi:myo-inositol 2-dehydrogenase/D-chiro-inositol 1-dehydrogenase
MKTKQNREKEIQVNRRDFLAQAGAAALTYGVLQPVLVRGQAAQRKIKLGLIGCGGRGSWIAGLFKEHGGYEIHAAADYFQDRLDGVGQKFGIPAGRLFSNLSGYEKLLECGVEAVAIETPPYFHPEQAAASVAAGLHVYMAKPPAVDVPGCLSIEQSGQKASAKKLCFLVDFQTRANEFYIEALKRVHAGALGEFVFGESTYHAGSPFEGVAGQLAKDPKNPELQLRAWGLSRELSGDIITEQNIHTLDVASWIMNQPPISAVGTGGHKGRTDPGTCWDHFVCLFEYPNNVGITFSSRQFEGHGTQPEGIRNRMFGSKGVLETEYGGQVMIRGRGETFYRGGSSPGIYKEGAVNNIAAFYRNVTEGNVANETVAPSVRSNLVTVLGRTAAYEKRKVTWDELLKNKDRLEFNLQGLKA